MKTKKIDELISQLEVYIENWKQIYYFINLVRDRRAQDKKQFSLEEENQFLDVKSLIAQQLESILAYFADGVQPIDKEEIFNVITPLSSLRVISEINEGTLRGIENQWHKIFIQLQSLLGQLKVQRQQTGIKSFFSFFSKNK
ncbi:MAG: hypothetical protein ACP5MG_08395 [Verrucomicrobiia bacterium]|jgi:hypothetical protein